MTRVTFLDRVEIEQYRPLPELDHLSLGRLEHNQLMREEARTKRLHYAGRLPL